MTKIGPKSVFFVNSKTLITYLFRSSISCVIEMRKRIRLSLVDRVEGDGEQGHDSDSDHIQVEEQQVNEQCVSNDNAFPVFVPKKIASFKRPKKSWAPLSASSKQILMQFARRAKKLFSLRILICSASILNVPESRRDDVLALYNRILTSSSRKIDVLSYVAK